MCVCQDVFYLDLSTSRSTPDWLDPEMAEQLRHSVEARQLLEQEYEQVSPNTVCRSLHSFGDAPCTSTLLSLVKENVLQW